MSKKQQGYNKATSGASIQSTNASYGTEFATETNVQAVKQANAQSEAKKAQASGASIQSTNASYGTEFATETDVHAVKKQNAQSAAKQSQSSSSNQ
ncbi:MULTISPECIES: gamma-type small acid-soluble spore protein [Bacillus]|uniref:Small, acid-soluble spore protein gamma-type n=2 Tax=Bacillus anthracis TaxID=1392 RepID=Q84DX8_BACAN|nr:MULTISPECIES: gamma-type small acid-soluble spore protein [Bacillus]EJT19268.1 gamma-type small acid-soluble spore protein [Bacillus anthracis str. UR-1]EXJ22060.1 spore protein [Bacillus anthracis str. 95014]AAO83836.1 small acid-soluble protein gamma-type [Bacillus anthracis]AAP24546.1 small acid-soluble spore protein, gamma-type [Bacillus anthracis str. Ames]AAT29618.1 small acid-soluble spore protein, gamma-type [Bacillus anthracis str. 'Ames Ancestor']